MWPISKRAHTWATNISSPMPRKELPGKGGLLPCLLALFLLLGGDALPAPEEAMGKPLPDVVESLRLQLAEARELAAQLKEEAAQAAKTAGERERELAELRGQYATLLLETDRLAKDLVRQDLEAAHLIREAEGEKNQEPDAVLMLNAMAECRRLLQEAQEAWERYQKASMAALEAAQASEALRDSLEKQGGELEGRMAEAREALGLATLPQLVASSGSTAVLQIDQAAQLVLLDQGSLHGLREGQVLYLSRNGESLVRLKVAIVRPLRAVAIPIAGKLEALAPGTLLRRETP